MKLFYKINPSLIYESQIPSIPTKIDEIDDVANSIATNMSKEVTVPKDVLDSFKLKDSLNPDIWINGKLNPKIRTKLIQIAKDFFNDLEIPKEIKIRDIIFTGSLANFNWSKFSDIDLHIVLDFNQFDAEPVFITDYFYAQKSIWNQEHDIKIFNYPIELYVQDVNDKLVATAIYSVLNDKWVLKPKREAFTLDKKAIKDKAEKIIYQLRDIRQDYTDKQYQTVVNKVTKLKEKIKQMRNAGLEKGGELSLENLVFKVLRRTPFMDILDSYKSKAYDSLMSVSETLNEDNTFVQGGILLIKGAPLEDGTQRLYVTAIKDLVNLNRTKNDLSKGVPAKMAILTNQIYRLNMVNHQLKAQGVAWDSEAAKLKSLGLKKGDVVLNNNKTPLHWRTLKFTDISQALHSIGSEILGLPNIKW